MTDKTKSAIETWGTAAVLMALFGVAFNSGIQYNQLATMQKVQADHDSRLRVVEGYKNLLVHIDDTVQNLAAEQELKRTGASR